MTRFDRLRCCISATLVLASLLFSSNAEAQFFDFFGGTTPKAAVELKPEEIDQYLRDTAKAYAFTAGGRPLTLIEQPLLDWQNTTRLSEQGFFYAWTLDDRPMVLGCFFTFKLPTATRAKHELLSMADGEVKGTLDGETVWNPKTSLVDFKRVPEAQAPAASEARRKLQWSQIARRFSAQHVHPEGEVTELRRMTKPIYSYRSPQNKIIDGVIVPMVISTDPEVFLIFEARETDQGPAWFYAVVPSHYHELRLSIDGKNVWSKPLEIQYENMQQGDFAGMRTPYTSFHPSKDVQ